MIQSTKLTNLQLELLKIFSKEISEEELLDVKRMLARYFSAKTTEEADRIWDKKGLTNEDMDRWLEELS